MLRIKEALHEIIDLFIDDANFAVTIVVWAVMVWFLFPYLGISPRLNAMLLFLGLAVILIESTTRRARK